MRNRACFQDTKQITRGAMRPCDSFRVAALRENRRNRVAGDAARGGGNSAFPMGTLPIRKTDTIPPCRSAVFYNVLLMFQKRINNVLTAGPEKPAC